MTIEDLIAQAKMQPEYQAALCDAYEAYRGMNESDRRESIKIVIERLRFLGPTHQLVAASTVLYYLINGHLK